MKPRVTTYPCICALAIATFSAWVAGCTVGPDYRRPDVPMPARWSEPSGGTQVAAPLASQWWKLYGDTELDALIERAIKSNLDLQRAEYRIREARAMLRQNASASWPSVNASISAERGQESENAPGVSPFTQGGDLGSGASLQNLFQAGFDANWELDLFGGTRRSVEASRADVQSAAFDRDAVALSLTAEVARAYVDLRSCQAQLDLAHQAIATQRDALAMVRARYAGGLATDVDLAAAEAQFRNVEAAAPPWQTQCKQTVHRIGVLLGEPPETLIGELAPTKPLNETPPVIAAGLPSDLLRRRPDIQSAERQVAAATARIGVATAELYPKFSLGASLGLASFTAGHFFDPNSTIWSIGPSMSWPIFRGGQIKATIDVRDMQAQQALLVYRQTILIALEDVENALAAYDNEQQRHAGLVAAQVSSQQALAHIRALYQGGLIDFRSVLDEQQRLLQAQSNLQRSTAAEWTDLIALCKALGGGWSTAEPPASMTLGKREISSSATEGRR